MALEYGNKNEIALTPRDERNERIEPAIGDVKQVF